MGLGCRGASWQDPRDPAKDGGCGRVHSWPVTSLSKKVSSLRDLGELSLVTV
jgi:hypothetical protein